MVDEGNIKISKLIKQIRQEQKITQKVLAHKTGLLPTEVCLLEQGKVNITIKRLEKVCEVLGYDLCLVRQAPEFVVIRKYK